jgi:hypothetical protein
MHLLVKITTILLVLLPLSVKGQQESIPISARGEEPSLTLWNIDEKGLFDGSNKAYAIQDGVVTVDLERDQALCPTGLGHLTRGKTSVKQVQFTFASEAPGTFWLHIQWNPGGSGHEQYEVHLNGKTIGTGSLVDVRRNPYQVVHDRFRVKIPSGASQIAVVHISGDSLHFQNIVLTTSDVPPSVLNPDLEFPTLASYEEAIKSPGVMLDRAHLRLFATADRREEAQTIFRYLIQAYDELYRLAGTHTQFKIVIYHFPEKSRWFSGGTSNCTLRYGYERLDLSKDKEWQRHGVPHVSGYIDEMAHNFVDVTGVQFGGEMVGWSIGIKVSQKVAANPILQSHIEHTRVFQEQTFDRYITDGYVLPSDVPANKVDRIHAHLLWECEQAYGSTFWSDFFKEVMASPDYFRQAKGRDERYQLTIACFDRLPGLRFSSRLNKLHISTTVDVKSLKPERKGWNRKLFPPLRKEFSMPDEATKPPASENPKVLYSYACQLARSTQESELASLQTRLMDVAFLTKLDSAEAYEGQATRLRVAGVMQVLAENHAPPARKVLLALTTSPAFLKHRARVELLIQALAQIKPAPQQAVVFWDKHCHPEDGYSSVTVWALLENGSPPAIALFERKMQDIRFPETERRYWLTACVLQYRNDLPLLQTCHRLLESRLEEPYRLLLVDVLFDYKPDDWYGAGHWYKPPPGAKATTEALEQLRALGRQALETQSLSKLQQEKVKIAIQEFDHLLRERKH